MDEIVRIVACCAIYFLIVYLFVIRREANPIVPWVVCIMVQAASMVLFSTLVDLFKSILPDGMESTGKIITYVLLFVINIAAIYFMFGIYLEKINKKHPSSSKTRKKIKVAPININTNQNVQNSESDVNEEENAITISYIEKMINDGRNDEAMKYLKMLAYYSKDDQTKTEAKKMIKKLSEESN